MRDPLFDGREFHIIFSVDVFQDIQVITGSVILTVFKLQTDRFSEMLFGDRLLPDVVFASQIDIVACLVVFVECGNTVPDPPQPLPGEEGGRDPGRFGQVGTQPTFQEIKDRELFHQKLLGLLDPFLLFGVVKREDIDEDAHVGLILKGIEISLHEHSVFCPHLGKVVGQVIAVVPALAVEARRDLVIADLQELFIIRPRHDDIQIVVPGDEASVTHSAQQRSCGNVIPEIILMTDTVDLVKYFQFKTVKLVQCFLFQINLLYGMKKQRNPSAVIYRSFVFRFFLERVQHFGQKRRGHTFCVRQKYDINTDFGELLDHIVVHVGTLPVRTVKESVEMVFFPCLHLIH